MTRNLAARGKGRRGVAAAELAVCLPLLAFLVVASVDFARLFYYEIVLDGCARNGAIYGQITANDPQSPFTTLQAATLADVTGLSPAPTITAAYGPTANGPFASAAANNNGYVQVTVTWNFATIVQYPGIPSQTTLTRACVMAVPPATPVSN